MNPNRIKAATNFLKTLEDTQVVLDIMQDRMDSDILKVITDYAKVMTNAKSKTSIPDEDFISCTLILGYLLKTHVDREDLSSMFKGCDD